MNGEDMRTSEWPTNEAGYRLVLCPDCGAEVFVAETLGGVRELIDPTPSLEPDAHVVVEERGQDRLISHRFSGYNRVAVRRQGKATYREHSCG